MCGPFPDVITAPSGKIGNHACDSDHDGALKDSSYCYCSDCNIHPERCSRKGDPAFCACDSTRQYCRPRACIAGGTCGASDPSSYYWTLDCNDYNRARYPNACEVCGDQVDDNCSGSTTDCSSTNDVDRDGFSPPQDCNDNNAAAHPGATEIECNAVDEDCSGTDLCGTSMLDPDGDGFSAPADCNEGDASVYPGAPDSCGDGKSSDCDPMGLDCPGDRDADGYAAGPDCDDTDPAVHPGATDLCGDRIDQDCGGGDRACVLDEDRDGYDAISAGGTDCVDLDSAVHPGAREACGDAVDQDCSGADVSCEEIDADGDAHAAAVFGGDDCDDTDDSVFPGAPEVCGDGIDSNCDHLPDLACAHEEDEDGDGFMSLALGDADCNDRDSRISPLASELCGDGVDNDCSGVAEDGCAPVTQEPATPLDFVNPVPSGCGCRIGTAPRGSAFAILALPLLLAFRAGRRR